MIRRSRRRYYQKASLKFFSAVEAGVSGAQARSRVPDGRGRGVPEIRNAAMLFLSSN
jgi:hypothetical protein